MLSNLPDWIGAGAAIAAVTGGLLGVYTTTQSRLDLAEEKMVHAVQILDQLSIKQKEIDEDTQLLKQRVAVSEVSADHLKEGQDRLHESLNSLTVEVRSLNQTILAKHD